MQNPDHLIYSTGRIVSQLVYRGCKIAQYVLICVFYTLLFSLSYLYLTTLFKLEKTDLWTWIWLAGGIWVQFSMVFNYTMCVIVKPGRPTDIEYFQIAHIRQNCRKCKTIKVARSHHCSMCDACILQMDHHCPWIGGCVGHHNRVYFLNFLTYTLFGLFLLFRMLDEYMQKPIYRQEIQNDKISDSLMFETYVFITTLIVVLGLFGLFHWYLALAGKTTLQFCFDDPRYTPSQSVLHNISLIFGTKNVISMFLPQLSVLKIKGFEWQNGIKSSNTTMLQIQHNNLTV